PSLRISEPSSLEPLALVAHEDLAVALLDRPAGERAQGRCAHGFTGAQVERGVVPWATHRLAGDETLRERAAVVRALGADRENFATAANEQDLVVADTASQRSA